MSRPKQNHIRQEEPKRTARRDTRVPLGSFRTKLHIPEDQLDTKNWNYRWIRDTGNRVEQAQNAGYVFVEDDGIITVGEKEGNTDIGSKISVLGGEDNRKDSGSYKMFLMKQPIDFYMEDKAAKQERNDSIKSQIHRTLNEGDKVENSYIPKGSGGNYVP